MIPLQDQETLRRHFAQVLTNRLRIDYFGQRQTPVFVPGQLECPYCKEAETLVRELAALSPRISLTRHELRESQELAASLGVDRVPAIVIRGLNNRPVRFFGLPTGAQFNGFVDTLVEAATGSVNLQPETLRHLRRIRSDVSLRVFVLPSCPHSPPIAQAAFRFGLQNVKIKVEVNEAGEFPELAQRMSIRAVPALVIDEQVVVLGAMDETKMAEAVLRVVEGKELDQSFGSRQFTPFNPAPSRAAAPSQQRVTSSGLIIPG